MSAYEDHLRHARFTAEQALRTTRKERDEARTQRDDARRMRDIAEGRAITASQLCDAACIQRNDALATCKDLEDKLDMAMHSSLGLVMQERDEARLERDKVIAGSRVLREERCETDRRARIAERARDVALTARDVAVKGRDVVAAQLGEARKACEWARKERDAFDRALQISKQQVHDQLRLRDEAVAREVRAVKERDAAQSRLAEQVQKKEDAERRFQAANGRANENANAMRRMNKQAAESCRSVHGMRLEVEALMAGRLPGTMRQGFIGRTETDKRLAVLKDGLHELELRGFAQNLPASGGEVFATGTNSIVDAFTRQYAKDMDKKIMRSFTLGSSLPDWAYNTAADKPMTATEASKKRDEDVLTIEQLRKAAETLSERYVNPPAVKWPSIVDPPWQHFTTYHNDIAYAWAPPTTHYHFWLGKDDE